MNRLLFLAITLLLLNSCKEKGPFIDFGAKASDTSFLASPEAPLARKVLVEEFTGVSCPNCPTGQSVLRSLDAANPGRLAIIGIQLKNNTQTEPYDKFGVKTINDNRSQAGTDLCTGIYGTNNSLPSAGIDRSVQSSAMLTDRTQWPAIVNARLLVPSKANMAMTSSYNAATRTATVKVHVAYTSAVTGNQSLTLALIEGGVVDAQELPVGDTAPAAQNYVHQHVLRDILTSVTGSPILGGITNKQPGQVYERVFVYTLPANVLNPDNCAFVAFVSNNDGADKEVVQSEEVKLK